MNCYDKNMDYLRKYHKYLFIKLDKKDTAPTNNILENIQSIDTKDGDKAVLIHYKTKEYRLNSIYRPSEEAKRWAEQFNIQHINTTISMFGFGNGVFTRALINKMGESDYLFIYEPCIEILDHVLSNYDITDILSDERIRLFVVGLNEYELHHALHSVISITNIKSQIQCIHPNYDKMFTENCINFYKELKDSYNSEIININTTIKLANRTIENILNNMEFLSGSYSLLQLSNKISEGIPAIVVAAGPSVEENIEELKKAKGKSVIIAVDRILDYLLDAGIEPDFVVTLDPMKDVKYFSRRDDITIPLMSYMEANNDILKKHKGRKIFCTTNPFVEELYRKTNKTPPNLLPSGSVAIVAFTICIKLGFKRIILVGQDLAFQGEISHAGGLLSNKGEEANVYVEGLDGDPVKSRRDWKEFIIRYQDLISLRPDVEVIDAKKSGAKIKGTINMPFSAAVAEYCDKSIDLDKVYSLEEEQFESDDLYQIRSYLLDNVNTLISIKGKAKKAMKDCDILLKESRRNIITKKTDKALNSLSKINKYIEEQKIYSLMDPSVIAKTAKQLTELLQYSDDNNEDASLTFMKSKFIYESIIEVSDFIQLKLEEAIKKI